MDGKVTMKEICALSLLLVYSFLCLFMLVLELVVGIYGLEVQSGITLRSQRRGWEFDAPQVHL